MLASSILLTFLTIYGNSQSLTGTERLFRAMDTVDCKLFLAKATVFHDLIEKSTMDKSDFDVKSLKKVKNGDKLLESGFSSDQLWSKGLIPVVVDDKLTNDQIQLLACAISFFHENTTVRFVRKQRTDSDYLFIQNNETGLCYSETLGKKGGMQIVNLGSYVLRCWQHGAIIHELMHVVGLFHEQARDDRDHYVSIHWENIPSYWHDQFMTNTQLGLPYKPIGEYDYASIMHYPRNNFMRPSMTAKLKPIDENNNKMGNRLMPTDKDISKINALYEEVNCNKPVHKPDVFIIENVVPTQFHEENQRHSAILIIDGSDPVEAYHPTSPKHNYFIRTNQKELFKELCQTWIATGGLIGGHIYMAGSSGVASCGGLNLLNTYVYDVVLKKFSIGPRLKSPRGAATGAVLHRKLIICGGIYIDKMNKTVTQRSCEQLDPMMQQWNLITNMSEARYLATSAAHKGTLYIIGGKKSPISHWTTTVQRFDYGNKTWSLVKPMTKALKGLSAASYGDYVMTCGANDEGTGACEMYHPDFNEWYAMGKLRNARQQFSMIVFNGELYAIMGLYGWRSVEKYRTETDTWESARPTNTSRYGFLAIAMP